MLFRSSGFQADIAYDPAFLSVVSVDEGDFLGQNTFFVKPDLSKPGVIGHPAAARIGGGGVLGTGVTGSGTLVTVTFKADAAGTSALGLSNVKLVNPPSETLPVTTVDGEVKIS